MSNVIMHSATNFDSVTVLFATVIWLYGVMLRFQLLHVLPPLSAEQLHTVPVATCISKVLNNCPCALLQNCNKTVCYRAQRLRR